MTSFVYFRPPDFTPPETGRPAPTDGRAGGQR
ncbi:hypothetical protein Mnod_4095 [Methylobacterium nodulans ORS 2060]|uniref:Uncharacterized protein n=1 Tax=Methylobacterium nodulans (strain LMG 21967 / CNCM I-2342 / ORS 2060) TaxID=460265 RepID=B8ITQ8_METNO|nr:hypothetical protein Mnod_4095 [Methylobacterium nodulans ORS 2060]